MSDWIGTGNFCSFKRKENFSNQDKHSQTLVTTLVLDGNLFRTLETGCIHNIKVNIFPPNLLMIRIIINILLLARLFSSTFIIIITFIIINIGLGILTDSVFTALPAAFYSTGSWFTERRLFDILDNCHFPYHTFIHSLSFFSILESINQNCHSLGQNFPFQQLHHDDLMRWSTRWSSCRSQQHLRQIESVSSMHGTEH